MPPVILDLCGGSGSWSRPYVEAGYDVRLVTLPDDVRLLRLPAGPIRGVLAAPPCTVFATSGNRWHRTAEDIREGLSVVDACLRIIALVKPDWWCLENPVGTLGRYIGLPKVTFQPWEYGDPYSKRTCLWGEFRMPLKCPVEPVLGSIITTKLPSTKRAERSLTPAGFARAFYLANP